jgi:hypothetical protein
MSMTHAERTSTEAATYGGLVDATGGVVTVILAIVGLAGVHPNVIVPITVIVFGAALLIQGGTMLSEYTRISSPIGAAAYSGEHFGGSSLSALFLVGAAGIVLGVLALLGIAPTQLTAIAVIAFGSALVLSSNSVRNLYMLRTTTTAGTTAGMGSEMVAAEMASGSAGVQMLAGLAAIVLGIIAVSGTNPEVLTLAALLVLGATVILTGSTLSGVVQSFMPSSAARVTTS